MSEKENFDGTKVDLGEDLLEATRVLMRPGSAPAVKESAEDQPEPEDLIQRGEILMNERLFDDAKKVFRRILREDPGNSKATEHLDEIQKHEIQELLAGEAPRRKLGQRTDFEDSPAEVLSRMESELHLNFEKSELKPIPDLFANQANLQEYSLGVEAMISGLNAKERLDIGIAHLEMGLFGVAQTIFESAVRNDDVKIEAMYLLGLAMIHGGRAIEATIRLEPLARDLTLSESQKVDFLYLMGLAFEKLHDEKKARDFYRRVAMLDPKYRDVQEKLK